MVLCYASWFGLPIIILQSQRARKNGVTPRHTAPQSSAPANPETQPQFLAVHVDLLFALIHLQH